jgi:hypothetical protein
MEIWSSSEWNKWCSTLVMEDGSMIAYQPAGKLERLTLSAAVQGTCKKRLTKKGKRTVFSLKKKRDC